MDREEIISHNAIPSKLTRKKHTSYLGGIFISITIMLILRKDEIFMLMVATKEPFTLFIVDNAVIGKVKSNLPYLLEAPENLQGPENERGM